MKLTALLVSCLLSSTLWLPAQTSPGGTTPPATAAAAPVTVIGCLVGLNGSYTLTNASNKQYRLEGDSLHSYSGQKVRAVGTLSYTKKSGTGGKMENMLINMNTPTLTVSRIEKLADTCTPGK
jgi:hypothetical protein